MKWVARIFENKIDDKQFGGGVVTSTTDALFEMIHHWCEAIIIMVKKVISQIVRPFVHICNVYSETGVFPDKMKIAKVVPLFKSGEKMCLLIIDHYPCYCNSPEFWRKYTMKEWIHFSIIMIYLALVSMALDQTCILVMHFLELVEEITSSLDNKKYSVGIFIDLKKAFDTIDRDILAKK